MVWRKGKSAKERDGDRDVDPISQLPAQTKFCLNEELPELTRRQLLGRGAYCVGYLSGAALLPSALAQAQASYTPTKKLIWINLNGGWDILESTDPKPASTGGIDMIYGWDEARTVTSSRDVRIGRFLPGIAALGSDLIVVRGLSMGTTSHEAGSVYMNTGILSNNGIVNAASIPAIVASEATTTIPIIQLGGGSEVPTDRGLLKPVSVVRASNLDLYRSMYPLEEDLVQRNLRILNALDKSLKRVVGEVGTSDRMDEASAAVTKIIGQINNNVGSRLQLNDEDRQPFAVEAGSNMGRGNSDAFALALKLVKNNLVTGVTLGLGGFDTHNGQTPRLQPILEQLDFLVARLVAGLKAAKKLDSTLIVLYSDFGRTPKVNNSDGRDHWPTGGAMMIGGGIAGGRAVGSTDDNLVPVGTNLTSGAAQVGAAPLAPTHLGGSVLQLLLGSGYMQYRPYLQAIPALTRLKSG